MTAKKIALSLKDVSFSYKKGAKAICNFSIDVEEGSFTTLLGESGCGKTTILRLISGFLQPDSGKIEIDGKNQDGIEPNDRKIGMVFQDYALFPHMTVKKNILYGVKTKNKSEKENILQKTATSLDLQNLLERYPNELSGGQQQRVALARVLILNPKILLMDEPLSSLDTKLREKVRDDLKEIQKKFKITTIYVTHDREEALSLSDRIAVIKNGKILQEDSPKELYFHPKNAFTADFIGHANFFSESEGKFFMVRPEWFALDKEECFAEKTDSLKNENFTSPLVKKLSGTIVSSSFLGEKTRFLVELEDKKRIYADIPTLESDFLNVKDKISLKILKKCEIKDFNL